jgi:hypothetical protein
MSAFDFSKPVSASASKAEATRRIKQWVEDLQVLQTDDIVHVAELQCHEPDCPDYETVITLMYSHPAQDRTIKIIAPLAQVTQEEVVQAVRRSFADGPPAIAALKAALARAAHACPAHPQLPQKNSNDINPTED